MRYRTAENHYITEKIEKKKKGCTAQIRLTTALNHYTYSQFSFIKKFIFIPLVKLPSIINVRLPKYKMIKF